jgi:hypothetical protein
MSVRANGSNAGRSSAKARRADAVFKFKATPHAASLYEKGGHSPPPVSGESSRRYKRRILADMQTYLPAGSPFSSVRLTRCPTIPARWLR